jgi:uncharacterized membrane protein YGL010W
MFNNNDTNNIKYNIILIIPIVIGYFFDIFLNNFNIKNGMEGLNFYEEFHKDKLNCIIHTLTAPFIFYSISCLIPSMVNLSIEHRGWFQYYMWTIIFTHYIKINILCGILCIFYYIYPMIIANEKVNSNIENKVLFLYSLKMFIFVFILQEFVGHYLYDNTPSLFTIILNQILYSTYFSVYHFFY